MAWPSIADLEAHRPTLSPALLDRVEHLAEKSTAGTLTDAERTENTELVKRNDLLTIAIFVSAQS